MYDDEFYGCLTPKSTMAAKIYEMDMIMAHIWYTEAEVSTTQVMNPQQER